MEILTLKGFDLYQAFIAGARKLISQKKHLNQINVFPVPDGDTGSNMSFLMQTIINEAKPSDNLSETAKSIANAAIVGSRGNSGIIFAEFFNGLYERLKGKAKAGLDDFVEAVKHATQKAYKAIMNPVEGTILTVLRKAFDISGNHKDFNSYFKVSLEQAKKALAETTEQLEVLKKNGVVDAGAEGFTAFLEGINYYLETGVAEIPVAEEEAITVADIHEMTVTERYCTEALLINVNRTAEDLKQTFKDYGSSLIVSGRSEKMRIHIHTDNPETFFLKLREFGQVLEQKIDDMIRQQQAIAAVHPKIALVTDSIADIPMELMDKYQISFLPMHLLVDDVSYLDRLSVTTDTFYELLKVARSFSSAQPDRRTIERTLDFLADHYEHVLVVTVAERLSGTYNAISQYAKTNPKVTVFDSKQNSGAEGLLVLEAAKLIWDEKPLDEVLRKLELYRSRTKIYVSVKTLKYMVRQGRVGKATGLLAKILNLKPVISLDSDGAGLIKEKAFSLKKNENQILDLLRKAPVQEYIMVHSLEPERAEKLARRIENAIGIKPTYTTMISPIVAMNAGIGAIGVAAIFEREVV